MFVSGAVAWVAVELGGQIAGLEHGTSGLSCLFLRSSLWVVILVGCHPVNTAGKHGHAHGSIRRS